MVTAGTLVPIQSAEQNRSHCGTRQRPSATFLAHLIAVASHAPQTRERRRADPHEAIAAYTRALSLDDLS